MKRIFSYFAWASLLLLSGRTMAEDYLMPKFAYEEKTISLGETITFYDFMGEDDIPSSTSSNSYATVVFRPAEAGYAVKVHFEYIEMKDDGNGWISYFDIFNGVFDKNLVNNGTSWPSSISSETSPAQFQTLAEPLEHYENCNVTDVDFLSTDISGALSFCFHYRYAAKIRGWKAVVSTEKMENMTILGATADYSFINTEIWGGKSAVALAGLSIATTGSANPYALTSVRFTLNGADVIDASSLTLYEGQAANAVSLKKIDAVFSHVGENYEVTLNRPLTGGENKFTIAADIAPSAPFEATISVNISGVETTDETFTTFTPATPVELRVAAMYLMTKDATYSIGQEVSFYDDGGKDGNISENFDGKVVFRPANNNEKVKLVFNNIHIFYSDYAASSSGLVDWLYVYNGNSTANEDLLFQALQSDYTTDVVIKSTADNGSLTVVHRSRSASTNLKSGWEATVSTFTPQPMHIQSVENTKQTGSTVSAGSSNLQIAGIKIITEETEPALVVQSLSFNTANTFPQISTAKLYYTKDNTFSTNTLIGTASVESDKVTITAESEIRLREGENYLWIAYDLSPLAANDRKVDIALEKLTFSNSVEYTAFQPIEGCMTIENIAVQDCGEQTITVQGEWQYTHTVASEYSSRYKADDCEQTIVFRPAGSGNMIQIDYRDFDVYYSSSAYYVRATYIVYSGVGTTGEKLWELDANGKKPEHIRSTAADGAVTILFNANTLYSSYTGDGWHATVREYTPQQMQIDNIIVEQASDKLVKPGEQQAAILDLNLQTTGTLSPLSLNSLTLDLKGSEQNISRVYLLQDAAVLAWADPAAQVTLTIDEAKELNEYSNRFTIAFDLKQDATVGQTVDAALMQITTNLSSVTVSDGDPEGERQIKNVLLLQSGDNGTVVIGEQSLVLYDDGGPDDNYTSNFEGYITFSPQDAGHAIELVFKDFEIAYLYGSDPFKIYYTDSYSAELTADKTYGMYSEPKSDESVISAADDGSITVYVKMPASRMRGFEVEVREHLLTNLKADSLVVTSLAPQQQTKGSTDHLMLKAELYVSGDRTPLVVTGVQLTAELPLTNVRVYATADSETFSTTDLVTGPYTINQRGIYHFWVVADISQDAQPGERAQLTLQSITISEQNLIPTTQTTATITIVSGMHGYYQIGNSYEADYPTLNAALQNMAAIGLDGAVTLALETGTYMENITIPQIKGSGAGNTLTITSVSGNCDDVLLQYEGSLNSSQGVLTIDGADYLTLRAISLTSNSTSNQGGAIVVVRNGANNLTIDNCHIYTAQHTETSDRLDLIRLDASDNNYNNNFTLINSSLEGGYVGTYILGHNAAADQLQQNLLIENNRFVNQGSQMIYADAVHDPQIINNTFRAEAKKSSFAAIDWILFSGTFTFAGNDILITANENFSVQPFYLRPNSYQDKSAVLLMYNNVINVQSSNDYASYSANFNSNLPVLHVAYNTMVIESAATASSPFYMQSTPAEGSIFVNNIFQATNKGYAVRYKNAAAISSNISYENNILYTADATFGAVSAVDSFEKWITEVGATDKGNLNEQVIFAGNTLLLPRQTNDGHLLTAQPLDWVTTDITGNQRSLTPTIGAYEYDEDLFRIPQLTTGYPKIDNIQSTSADLVINTDNFGSAKILVLSADASVPSVENVLASDQVCTLTKEHDVVFTINNLTEETTYKVYIVLLSPLDVAAETIITTDEFTTLWTLRPVELQPIENQTVEQNTVVTLNALLATEYEQAQPYSYQWYTTFDDAVLSDDATITITANNTTEYICRVSDRYNQTAYLTTTVKVVGNAAVADFEEYNLISNEKKYVEQAWEDAVPVWLYSGTYGFANTPDKLWGSFTGYAISADKSAEYTGNYMTDQFRSAAGGAAEGDNFAVAYYSAPSMWFAGHADTVTLTNTTEAQVISGFYITNTVYTADAVLNGDYSNPRFGVKDMTGTPQKDYLKLTINGYNNGLPTGAIDYYLADYSDDDSDEHYLIDTWQWVDLSALGAVNELQFEMFTTKSDDYGFTTPTYFALDNFGGQCFIDTLPKITLTSHTISINLNDYFTYEQKGKVIYSLTDQQVRDMEYTLADNLLQLNATSDNAVAGFTICQTQRGKRQYKYLPVEISVSTGIQTLSNRINIFPTLITNRLTVTTDAGNCLIQVYAADGRLIRSVDGGNHNDINTSAWTAGQYIIRVSTQNEVMVSPVMKR